MNRPTPPTSTKSLIFKQQLRPIAALLLILQLSPALLAAENDSAPASATGDSGSDPRILPDLEQERLQALANSQLPDTQTLWLETANESFLGLYKPANQATPKGAVLLLHHDRTSADWPGTITTLRQGLPDQGWHTLSIALPDQPEYIPPRTTDIVLATQESSNAAVASEPEDKLGEYFQQISARIESALAYLTQQQPPQVLIIGEGTGGYWALRYNAGLGESSQLFTILIDSLPPSTPTQPDQITLISQLQRPTLDLYHGNGLKQQPLEVLAQQRREAAQRQGKNLLISSRMAPRAGDWRQPDKRLLGVIRGMMPRLLLAEPKPVVAEPRQQTPGRRK